MDTNTSQSLKRAFTLVAIATAVAACTDTALLTPTSPSIEASLVASPAAPGPLAILERATVRYKNIDNALSDGFVLLHDCETRDGGAAGALYYHPTRLTDGVLDPASPDALLYEPNPEGKPRLVAAELAIPYSLWTDSAPPTLLGTPYQAEDEFGVWALHIWIWRRNPNGMFAESNPRVSCGIER